MHGIPIIYILDFCVLVSVAFCVVLARDMFVYFLGWNEVVAMLCMVYAYFCVFSAFQRVLGKSPTSANVCFNAPPCLVPLVSTNMIFIHDALCFGMYFSDFWWNLYAGVQTEVDAAAQHLEEVLRLHFGGAFFIWFFCLRPGNCVAACRQEMKRSDSRAPCQWHQRQTQCSFQIRIPSKAKPSSTTSLCAAQQQ